MTQWLWNIQNEVSQTLDRWWWHLFWLQILISLRIWAKWPFFGSFFHTNDVFGILYQYAKQIWCLMPQTMHNTKWTKKHCNIFILILFVFPSKTKKKPKKLTKQNESQVNTHHRLAQQTPKSRNKMTPKWSCRPWSVMFPVHLWRPLKKTSKTIQPHNQA